MVRLLDDTRRCVVFLETGPGSGSSEFGARGFLVADGDRESSFRYLITTRQAAKTLEQGRFHLRTGLKSGAVEAFRVDGAAWSYHPNEAVNVAATAINLPPKFDCVYFETRYFVGAEGGRRLRIATGEAVKIISLLQLNQWDKWDLAIVHGGQLAVVPDKGIKIPISDPESGVLYDFEGYLVEIQAFEGLNGAPVFIRRPVRVRHARPTGDVDKRYMALYLLGMIQSPWSAPAIGDDMGGKRRHPPNLAIVMPAQRILDVLSMSRRLEEGRSGPGDKATRAPVSPPEVGENPRHREDFARLLERAIKKRPAIPK